jgi:hypothetical protein
MWKEDKMVIMDMEHKFTHLLGGYTVFLLVVMLITYWVFTRGRSVSQIKAEMKKVYAKHNPEKIADIDTIVEKWKGREYLILPALKKKYSDSTEHSM